MAVAIGQALSDMSDPSHGPASRIGARIAGYRAGIWVQRHVDMGGSMPHACCVLDGIGDVEPPLRCGMVVVRTRSERSVLWMISRKLMRS